MGEEKIKILKMIESGIITADEGLKLLEAIENAPEEKSASKEEAKWLRIKVSGGRQEKNYNIKVPVSMVKIALKLGAKFNINVDGHHTEAYYEQIQEAIRNEKIGEIVNIESDDGERVVISIE